jgi:hypothetical protein
MNRRIFKELLLVIILSLSALVITSSGLFSQYLNRPKERYVFVGVSHYWEDYFYYLDQFYQGSEGRVTTLNRFSIERFPPTLFYFNHIVLGKIGGMIGLTPFETYNISMLLLKFIFIMISYGVIALVWKKNSLYRVSSFLLFLFSSSFPVLTWIDNQWKLTGLPVIRTAAPMMERFGNIPNTIMVDITFLLSFLLCYFIFFSTRFQKISRIQKVCIVGFGLIVLSLTTLGDAAKTAVLLGGLICTWFISSFATVILQLKNIRLSNVFNHLTGIGLIFILSQFCIVYYLSQTISRDPVYQYTINWNIANQSAWSIELLKNPLLYIHSFGIILIAFVIGIFPFFKKFRSSSFQILLLSITIIAFLGYHLPIEKFAPVPRFRFLFPSVYIGVSVIAIYLIQLLSKKIHVSLFFIGLLIILCPSFITTYYSLIETTKPLVEPDYHFAYMPRNMYEGFMKLKELPNSDSIVLGNPTTSMDILIPGFSGKYTYSGHMLTTYNIQQKDDKASKFFWNVYSEQEARQFLQENNITYVLVTMYDGNWETLKNKYPMLHLIYQNSSMSIFSLLN